jgi:glycosyltransferase involved in cell wall biosynthesis
MFLTIFTATFNRANYLPYLYKSLLNQEFKDFEWIIVDDGSTDNTKFIVDKWGVENKFKIRYYFQHNQGKHIAYNRAIEIAEGELFISIDSDDELYPNILDLIYSTWLNIDLSLKYQIKGLAFRCIDENFKLIGKPMSTPSIVVSELDFRFKLKYTGEFFGCNRTEVLRMHPFPNLDENTRFCPEAIVWFEIARKYKTMFINKTGRVYKNIALDSIMGKGYNRSYSNYYLWTYYVNNLNDYFIDNPITLLKGYIGIMMDGLITDRSVFRILADCNNPLKKCLVLLLSPISISLWLHKKYVS